MRNNNHNIQVALFKQQKTLSIVVPVTVFDIYGYRIITIPKLLLPHAAYQLLELSSKHIGLLREFLTGQHKHYDCVVLPEITTIFHLIKTENIFIYGVLLEDRLISAYVFKNIVTRYGSVVNDIANKGSNLATVVPNTILSIASMVHSDYENTLIQGFTQALYRCTSKTGSEYIFVEATSRNKSIVSHLNNKISFVLNQLSSFFLYNYISPQNKPDRCLFIY